MMFHDFNKPSEKINELRINNCTGIYVVRSMHRNIFKDVNNEMHKEYQERTIPTPPEEMLKYLVDENVIYIGKGIGNGGLLKRFKQEFLHIGNGTFFRTVGAVLLFNPIKGLVNSNNYRFNEPEKQAAKDFIENNLEVSYECKHTLYEFFNIYNINIIEKSMIKLNQPIFNIQNNSDSSPLVTRLRNRCLNIARQNPDIIFENKYVQILRAQVENNWCVNYMCTTCGAVDLKKAIKKNEGHLFSAMMDLSVSELRRFPNYREVTRIAVDYLNLDERFILNQHWPTIFNEIGRAVIL